MSGHVVGGELRAEQTVDLRDPNRNRRAIGGRAGTSTKPLTAVMPDSAASWMNRRIARSILSPQSAPRRNRVEASLGRLRRFTVREIDGGSHHAISSNTSVVESEISVVAPP